MMSIEATSAKLVFVLSSTSSSCRHAMGERRRQRNWKLVPVGQWRVSEQVGTASELRDGQARGSRVGVQRTSEVVTMTRSRM